MTAVGFDGVERRGLMFVLSSPSGAGKTTLSRMVIERQPGLEKSGCVTAGARGRGAGGRVGRKGRSVRHRLAGHAAIARKSLYRRRQRVYLAAVGRRSREAV